MHNKALQKSTSKDTIQTGWNDKYSECSGSLTNDNTNRYHFRKSIERLYFVFQLNMKVLHFERPLVRLSGSATGMSLCFSQNSLQFGRVRKRGCKILKVMLHNKGDFGAR
jgi:hypothetical protein